MTPFTAIWNWFKAHPTIRTIILCLLVFALGFGTAIFARPAKVVEKERVVTQYQDKVVYQDRVVTQIKYVQVEKKHEQQTQTVTTHTDGTSTTVTQTTTDTNNNVNQTTDTDESKTKVETKYVTQIVEKEKLVLNQPNWRVYAGVGYQFAKFGGAPETGIPGMDGIVVQVGADRRIAGPVFLGVSLNTQYTAFLNLSAAF